MKTFVNQLRGEEIVGETMCTAGEAKMEGSLVLFESNKSGGATSCQKCWFKGGDVRRDGQDKK